jgi:thioredoxin reductase (NADPH)
MTTYDIAIVGAGPAGLSAALYAARFCRSTIVLHNGDARALRIPKTYNAPGFDEGVSGPDLIERMMRHATRFGAEFVSATIVAASATRHGFQLTSDKGSVWKARALILATGLNLNQIDLPHDVHEAAIADGVLRYCPVCDGFEHRGKRIGVVGCDVSGAGEALFLRQFSDDVTLLPQRDAELTAAECHDLAAAGVNTVRNPTRNIALNRKSLRLLSRGAPTLTSSISSTPHLACDRAMRSSVRSGWK